MADEAHRSQYGLTEKLREKRQKEDGEVEAKTIIGTACIIRDTLQNATYIGFTGTPISSKDRKAPWGVRWLYRHLDATQAVEDGRWPDRFTMKAARIHLKLDEKTLHLIDDEYGPDGRECRSLCYRKEQKNSGQMEAI